MKSRTLKEKTELLHEQLHAYPSIAIAYSGGVDSTLLLAVACRLLNGNVIAVTAVSPLQPASEVQDAFKLAKSLGAAHYRVNTGEMKDDAFVSNDVNRCYVCKKIIFSEIREMVSELGISRIAHAANVDDLRDYRPGMKAAMEMDILSPLVDSGMTKGDIRELSRQMGLPTWNKPSAACLASRIPYGTPITAETLEMIETAEGVLSGLGFREFRVRHCGETAKIEVRPADFKRLLSPERRLLIIGEFRRIGYTYITMDMEGYSSGSMNRLLANGNQEENMLSTR